MLLRKCLLSLSWERHIGLSPTHEKDRPRKSWERQTEIDGELPVWDFLRSPGLGGGFRVAAPFIFGRGQRSSQTRRGENMRRVSQLVGCSRWKNQMYCIYLFFFMFQAYVSDSHWQAKKPHFLPWLNWSYPLIKYSLNFSATSYGPIHERHIGLSRKRPPSKNSSTRVKRCQAHPTMFGRDSWERYMSGLILFETKGEIHD
jgi:hypothetical protein